MSRSISPAMHVAISICLAALLSACSGHADNDARKLPDPGGVAGASGPGAAGGGTTAGGDGASTDADDPSALAQNDNDDGSDGGDEGDSDWPALRQVPGGTLTWTVVYKGTGTTQTPEMKEVAVLHRKLQGTAHMIGNAGNPDEAPPPTPMDDINKAMQACGDDMACQQKAAMRAMTKDPGAVERGMRDAMTEAQRDTTWGTDSCTAVGEADDKATWSGMTPLGFNTGEGTRQGKRPLEDCTGNEGPRLVADDNSKTYTLTLPAGAIRVQGELGGRIDPVPRIVEFPQLLIKGIRYAALDHPLKGSVTLHIGHDRGLWSEGWDIPLNEEVSWTFTPEANSH